MTQNLPARNLEGVDSPLRPESVLLSPAASRRRRRHYYTGWQIHPEAERELRRHFETIRQHARTRRQRKSQ